MKELSKFIKLLDSLPKVEYKEEKNLIGTTISIFTDTKPILVEFGHDGTFQRFIIHP